MQHSNQIREFVIRSDGIDLLDVYVGSEGVLTGSARIAQEAREREARTRRDEELARKQAELERKRKELDAQVIALQNQFASERDRLMREIGLDETREHTFDALRASMARNRRADLIAPSMSGAAGGNGSTRKAKR
jgi:circadian clock protein KaiC